MFRGEERIRAEIPEFDLLKLDEVRYLHIEFRRDQGGMAPSVDLTLKVSYGLEAEQYQLTIKMIEVRQLRLPEIGGASFQIGELFVISVQGQGLEGLKYHVVDHIGGLSCYCQDFRFIEISREDRDNGNGNTVVWTSDADSSR
jgi:hypothetical protein